MSDVLERYQALADQFGPRVEAMPGHLLSPFGRWNRLIEPKWSPDVLNRRGRDFVGRRP